MKKNIKTLTGIRFFAALHVVLFHNFYLFGLEANRITPGFIKDFLKRGEAAVSFFFILSGFILVHVYRDKLSTKKEKKKYLLARVAKIYPLYLLAFILDIPRVVSYFFAEYDQKTALIKTFVSGLSYIFAIQSWIPRLTTVWNSPAWSISCEAFFYLSLILLLKPLIRLQKKTIFLIFLYLIPLTLYLAVVVIIPSIESSPLFITFWRSFPLLRIFEFLMGVIIYEMIQEKNSICNYIRRRCNVFFWGAIFLSIIVAISNFNLPDKVYNGILLAPFFLIIIIASYDDQIRGYKFFSHKTLQVLGGSSYALYIIHQPLKYYIERWLESSVLLGCLYLFITSLCSFILYKFFEIPIQVKIKNIGSRYLKLEKGS